MFLKGVAGSLERVTWTQYCHLVWYRVPSFKIARYALPDKEKAWARKMCLEKIFEANVHHIGHPRPPPFDPSGPPSTSPPRPSSETTAKPDL